MKKMFLSALLASSLMAGSNENYFGFSAGNMEVNGKSLTEKFSTDDTHYTASLGHYYNDSGRVYASFSYTSPSGIVDRSSAISVGYDFLLPVSKQLSLFAGPVLGYTWYELSDSFLSLDMSGFHYGAQAGAIAKVTNNIELEAGYRFLAETGKDSLFGENTQADDVRMWYVGANLRF